MQFASWMLELQEIWKHVSAEVAQYQQHKQQSAQETIETPKNKKEKDMSEEKLPTYAESQLESAEILENAEGFKILQEVEKIFLGFHNTTLNPRRLTLSAFTAAKVLLPFFPPPPMDENIKIPSRESRLLVYLKKNGREEFFGVELLRHSPAVFMQEVNAKFS